MPSALSDEERLFVANVAIRVHNRRIECGLSRIELIMKMKGDIPYEAARIQAKRLGNLEDARNCTTVINLVQIAKALNTTVAYLISETDDVSADSLKTPKKPVAKY